LKEATFLNYPHPHWRPTSVNDITLNKNHLSPFVDKSKPYYVLVDDTYGAGFEKERLTNLLSKQYGI